MKKQLLILLTAALGAGSPAFAQSSPDIQSYLNSDAFHKSIIAAYGVDSEIAPKPENTDIEAIQAAEPNLKLDTQQGLLMGAQGLEAAMNQASAKNGKFSAILPQLVGSIYFRLSTMTSGSQQTQYREQARRYLQQAVDMFPGYRAAHKNLARIYFQNGDPRSLEMAAKEFTKSIELGDKEAGTFVLLSKIYFDSEKYAAAEAAARQAIMMDPSIKESRTILAYALFSQERFNEAKAVFEEMLQDDPNNSDIWQMIANTYIQSNQIDEAAKRLEIVRFMGRANTDTLLLLGDVYMNKNMVDDAAEAYVDALALTAKDSRLRDLETFLRPVETLNNFQAFDLAMNLLAKVEATYNTALNKDEKNNILALRSEINIALGKEDEGAKNLKEILDSDPMNRRALLSLGQYYSRWTAGEGTPANEARTQRAEAIELALGYYDRAQQLIDTGNPEDREAARQAFIGEGQLLARERRLPEALKALESAQNIVKEDRIASYIEMIERVLETRS